jgi:hypothetical protein
MCKFAFRCRRKPVPDEKSSKELGAFIQRVERVSNLKKTSTDPWGPSDIGLFSRILKLENQDPSSLLPQLKFSDGPAIADGIGSLFDSKTGLWNESVITEDGSK